MTDLPGPILQLFFDAALQDYEKQTGINLIDHSLVKQLENCNSVESITALLQGQAESIREFRGDESELMKSIKHVVDILHTLSRTSSFGERIELLSLPAKATFAAFAILLGVVKDVSSSYDMLIHLFDSIGIFPRVDIYAMIPPTFATKEIIIMIMVELLSTIALATKQIMQGRLGKPVFADTPLHLASGRGHVNFARILLEHGADVNSQDVEGWTALHHASQAGYIEATRLLLDRGADAKAKDRDESTPIHLASGCGHVDIVQVLLEHGVDANSQDVEGLTPLHQAARGGHVEVARLLIEHGNGHVDTPRALFEYDMEVDAEDEPSLTPLYLASQGGHLEVVRLLLDHGENPNTKSGNRQTPLHGATENGHHDIILLLLDGDASVNAKDAHLWTPLHVASKTGDCTATLELLDHGAEVEAQDNLSCTPLHIASQEGHLEVARLLLNRHAHVDMLEADFETALHLAAYYGHPQVTRLLLDHGASAHVQNKNKKTPFELASEEGYHEVAELLSHIKAESPSMSSVTLPYTLPPPSFPTLSGSPILIGSRSEGSPTAEDNAPLWISKEFSDRRLVISIDVLPDDVLLEIFVHYANNDAQHLTERERAWQTLVQVCRRWRSVIFGSPRRLNLQLVCQAKTRARDTLDAFPALPLVIRCHGIGSVDDIIAVLERRDRVCQIYLPNVPSLDLEIVLAAMQQPFPELTDLVLYLKGETFKLPVVTDSFLGGSAPRLQRLVLGCIPFLGLRKLLLSTTYLVELHLFEIPQSGYFSPDVMVAALSTLTNLNFLSLQFQSPRPYPDQESRHIPPSAHYVLPFLTRFWFKGVTEYLEDLVACIDAPRLNDSEITFFNDIVFDTPQFIQFISRTPTSIALKKAHITLRNRDANLDITSQTSGDGRLNVKILCRKLDWQVSSLEQVCASCLPLLFMLEDLYIYEGPGSRPKSEDLDNIDHWSWLELLHPFIAVKNLYLSEQFALRIGPALQELVRSGTMEVLPALQNIFFEGLQPSGPVQEGFKRFLASRQATSRPIAISRWDNSDSKQDDVDSERDKVLTLGGR